MRRDVWAWAVLLAALFARLLSAVGGYDIVADVDPGNAGASPAAGAWLGTDALGRDVAWRMVKATDAFVVPAVWAAVVSVGLGGALGTLGGWFGGSVERASGAVAGLPGAAPRFVLVLLLATIFAPTPGVLALGCGLAFVPQTAAEVGARLGAMRRTDFVEASLVHGVGVPRVLGEHLLWTGCRLLLARLGMRAAAFFVVVETTLAYLGELGVQEPLPSFGNMVASGLVDGRLHLVSRLAPAIALWLLLAALFHLDGVLARQDAQEAA